MPTLLINTLESYNNKDTTSLKETLTFVFTWMHSTYTVIKPRNCFLVKHMRKVKRTGYINWEDSKRGVVSREPFRWEDF